MNKRNKNKHSEKKNLLIYAHYYIPDTASTGQILRELAEGMLDRFNITVICVVPSYLGTVEEKYKTQKYYFEEINGVKILRIRVPEFSKANKISRVKNILAYFFGAMSATFKVGKMDYVFSISQPPILGGLLGVWGKWMKHAKFIYNIQDFNPEQVMAVNYSKNKLIIGAMMWFDKFSCKRSDLIITVGRDLVETVNRRFKGKKVPKTVMINNWIDEKEIYPVEADHPKIVEFKKKYELKEKFIFMYSGNIGLYYDLENLLKVIEKFPVGTKAADGREVVFAFVGAGSVLDKLALYQREHHMDNVVFIPYQATIKNFYYHDMIIRACSISELYNNSKQERMQRNKVREEKLIKILEEEYHASKPVRFEDIIRRGYTKEMLEALYWVIERYKFAVNYVDMVDKDPLAKKKRFSSMLEEL